MIVVEEGCFWKYYEKSNFGIIIVKQVETIDMLIS